MCITKMQKTAVHEDGSNVATAFYQCYLREREVWDSTFRLNMKIRFTYLVCNLQLFCSFRKIMTFQNIFQKATFKFLFGLSTFVWKYVCQTGLNVKIPKCHIKLFSIV